MEEWGDIKVEEIREFCLSSIKPSEVLHIIGAPSSGKTFLELFIAYALKHIYPVGQVFCGTEDTQGAFSPVFGGAFVSSTYQEHDHKRFMSRQITCSKEECEFDHAIQYLDDLGYNKKISSSETVIQAHKNGSQWLKTLLIMGYQSIKDVPEKIVNAASKVFIFMEKEDSNRRRIHKAYFKTLVPEYKDFSKLMNDICGEKFVCLVVDLKSQSANLQECVTYFKAPGWKWKDGNIHPYPEKWKFGCRQFREWSDARHDPNAVPDFITNIQNY
uniref:Uncharacterized protein n=1 Tax=viral metagenome TaxID=1070528 RepID=A0A6C0JVJ8_9ZZZZ